jgi:WS/DGAT/MGAT family acyltransferase
MSADRSIVPLSGLDGVFLDLETPATPMHVGSVHLFKKPARGGAADFYPQVKRMLAARLDVAPIFSRRLAPMPLNLAHPVWLDGTKVDLDFHVRRAPVAAPGGQAELERCVAELHAQLLDRSRPLWMMYVFDGLADGRRGYYFKVHHAVLDGAAGTLLAAALYDTSARAGRRPRAPARSARGAAPGAIAVAGAVFSHDAGQFVRLLRSLPDAARLLASIIGVPAPGLRRNFSFGPRTVLNATIGAERSIAFSSLPLDEIKAIGARHDATINDVVLALCSGALRRYLARHGGVPRAPLIATMPISVREPGDTRFHTAATLSLVRLATHLADPVRRLRAVRAAASASKQLARRARSLIPTDFPSVGMPWVAGSLASLWGHSHVADVLPPIANVVISNVPGPRATLYTVGAEMEQYWPVSIVEHGIGLNITVLSYVDTLGFGFTAARSAVAEARELAADLAAAHAELLAAKLPRRRRAAAAPRRRARRAPARG